MRNRLLGWEWGGFWFIFLLGALWHFVYGWSGGNAIVGLLAPVNESIWEHLKLGMVPTLLFGLLAYPFIGRRLRHYWLVRAFEIYITPLVVILSNYGYTAILGHHLLVLDISTFALGVAAAQFAAYKLLVRPANPGRWAWLAVPAIAGLMIVFAASTVYPPELPVFYDFSNGRYGR